MNEEEKHCLKHGIIIFLCAALGGFLGAYTACHFCFKYLKKDFYYNMPPKARFFERYRGIEPMIPRRFKHFDKFERKKDSEFDKEFFEEHFIIVPKELFNLIPKNEKSSSLTAKGVFAKK